MLLSGRRALVLKPQVAGRCNLSKSVTNIAIPEAGTYPHNATHHMIHHITISCSTPHMTLRRRMAGASEPKPPN